MKKESKKKLKCKLKYCTVLIVLLIFFSTSVFAQSYTGKYLKLNLDPANHKIDIDILNSSVKTIYLFFNKENVYAEKIDDNHIINEVLNKTKVSYNLYNLATYGNGNYSTNVVKVLTVNDGFKDDTALNNISFKLFFPEVDKHFISESNLTRKQKEQINNLTDLDVTIVAYESNNQQTFPLKYYNGSFVNKSNLGILASAGYETLSKIFPGQLGRKPMMWVFNLDVAMGSANANRVYNSFFHNFDSKTPLTGLVNNVLSMPGTRGAIIHEFTHFLDFNNFLNNQNGFRDISWNTSDFYRKKRWPNQTENDFVTRYAYLNKASEDLAESVEIYALWGDRFREIKKRSGALSAKYDWIKNNVFKGKEFYNQTLIEDFGLNIVQSLPNIGLKNLELNTETNNVRDTTPLLAQNLKIPPFTKLILFNTVEYSGKTLNVDFKFNVKNSAGTIIETKEVNNTQLTNNLINEFNLTNGLNPGNYSVESKVFENNNLINLTSKTFTVFNSIFLKRFEVNIKDFNGYRVETPYLYSGNVVPAGIKLVLLSEASYDMPNSESFTFILDVINEQGSVIERIVKSEVLNTNKLISFDAKGLKPGKYSLRSSVFKNSVLLDRKESNSFIVKSPILLNRFVIDSKDSEGNRLFEDYYSKNLTVPLNTGLIFFIESLPTNDMKKHKYNLSMEVLDQNNNVVASIIKNDLDFSSNLWNQFDLPNGLPAGVYKLKTNLIKEGLIVDSKESNLFTVSVSLDLKNFSIKKSVNSYDYYSNKIRIPSNTSLDIETTIKLSGSSTNLDFITEVVDAFTGEVKSINSELNVLVDGEKTLKVLLKNGLPEGKYKIKTKMLQNNNVIKNFESENFDVEVKTFVRRLELNIKDFNGNRILTSYLFQNISVTAGRDIMLWTEIIQNDNTPTQTDLTIEVLNENNSIVASVSKNNLTISNHEWNSFDLLKVLTLGTYKLKGKTFNNGNTVSSSESKEFKVISPVFLRRFEINTKDSNGNRQLTQYYYKNLTIPSNTNLILWSELLYMNVPSKLNFTIEVLDLNNNLIKSIEKNEVEITTNLWNQFDLNNGLPAGTYKLKIKTLKNNVVIDSKESNIFNVA